MENGLEGWRDGVKFFRNVVHTDVLKDLTLPTRLPE